MVEKFKFKLSVAAVYYSLFAMVTHVYQTAIHGEWLALFAGLIVVPAGVAHGIILWFSAGFWQ